MKVNRQSLFMEKPLSAFDVNFELLHSGVASLPGIIDLYVYIIHQLYFIAAIIRTMLYSHSRDVFSSGCFFSLLCGAKMCAKTRLSVSNVLTCDAT